MKSTAVLDWLLEPDAEHTGVQFLVLRDLLDLEQPDPRLTAARREVMEQGPVPAILAHQQPTGGWEEPGGSPYNKYLGSHWQLHFLACLGADPEDGRVRRACEYVLANYTSSTGSFSYSQPPTPSGTIHCHNGNLVDALIQLGFAQDERLLAAAGWAARAVTGQAPIQYYKSGTNAPGFACAANAGQPCAWGAVKALRALTSLPEPLRTPTVRQALEAGAGFLLSQDPASAAYPYTGRVSSTWFKLGFPLSYWADVLELAEVLARLGFGQDPRLDPLWQLLLSKRDDQGRWRLENTLNGKMWADIDIKALPSKWITLRALRAFKRAGRLEEALN